MTTYTRWKPPVNPWDRVDLTNDEIAALRALKEGVASKEQQVKALQIIVIKFARTYDMSFRPGEEAGNRATTFAEGMRSVGSAIMEALNRPMKPSGDQNATRNPDSAAPRPGRRNPKPARPKDKPPKPAAG